MIHQEVLPPPRCLARPLTITVWSQRDYDIVQTLTLRVRLLAITQAVSIWWPGQRTERNARRRLRRLVLAGLLERYIVNAHPLLAPAKPLACWQPQQPPPDAYALSLRARSRWKQSAAPLEVFAASKKSANLFGSEAHGLPKLEQRDHDLLLADAYVAHRKAGSKAQNWIGENFLPKAGFQIKDPDAFFTDEHGHIVHVIESAGRYSPKQIATFHDHCDSLNFSYELW